MGRCMSLFKKKSKVLNKESKEKSKMSLDKNVVDSVPIFTKEDAKLIAKALKINFNTEKFDLDELQKGINVELEHGSKFADTNITQNDPILTGKIAYAHLKEFPDYYTRLKKLEEEAKAYWATVE